MPSVETMRRTQLTAIATAVLCTIGIGAGVATTTIGRGPDTATLQSDADALLRYGAPGVLVGIDSPDGAAEVRSGFGDTTARTPVPAGAQFRIGSFTKTFVATTVLQLVGEGRLSLDDTVERWLPGIVTGHGNNGATITVRQLLQHTSGLHNYTAELPYLADRAGFEADRFTTLTARDAVALAMNGPPNFAPGTDWSYSNTNYALAGMVIESVTGHRWSDEVRARIIEPLDLVHTSLPGTSPTVPEPHAVGYERFPGPDATQDDPKYGDAIDATELNPSWAGSAGEMISTTEDGNRFLQALVSGELLPPAQLAEMQTSVPATELDSNWPGARYGLGLLWIPNSCGGSWGHAGDIQGFMTRDGVTADGSRSVIVSINTDSPRRDPGVPAPTRDITMDLIDHALCSPG